MDHRSDLYSVGVMMYELLTGRLPFSGTETMDVLLAHATEDPPRELETPPPNMSDRPPPRPLCMRIRTIIRRLAIVRTMEKRMITSRLSSCSSGS